MSHGIHDLNSVRRLQPQPSASSSDAVPQSVLNMNRPLGTPAEIRKESFFDMLTFIFCPFYTFMSFTTLITLVDIFAYFCLLVIDFNDTAYLEPTNDALDTMGAKNAYRLQHDMEIYRWVTPMILHASFSHLVFNLIMQLFIGFRLEPSITWKQTAGIYVASGYGGVLMGCLMAPQMIAVGASAAVFGMLTATVRFRQIAYMAARWERLSAYPQLQFAAMSLGFMFIFLLLMSGVIPTQMTASVDMWGHFGGILTGFCLGYSLFLPENATWGQNTFKKATQAVLIAFLVGGLILFYAGMEVAEIKGSK